MKDIDFGRKFFDKAARELLYKRDAIDAAQQYEVDFLTDSAIVKAREADKYDIDIPRGD